MMRADVKLRARLTVRQALGLVAQFPPRTTRALYFFPLMSTNSACSSVGPAGFFLASFNL
jgi:hypothetical protein